MRSAALVSSILFIFVYLSSACAELLEEKKDDPIIHLIERIKDPDEEVRYKAIASCLDKKDSRLAPILINALQDKSAQVRECAASVLGPSKYPSAIPALIRTLEQDEVVSVRRTAAYALKYYEDPSVAEHIIKAARKDESPIVRKEALNSLDCQIMSGKPEPHIFAAVFLESLRKEKDKMVREEARDDFVGHKSDEMVPFYMEALKDTDEYVSDAGRESLSKITESYLVPKLFDCLKSEHAHVRENAAHVLGWQENRLAIEPLSKMLQDQNNRVRFEVSLALYRLKEKAPVDIMGQAIFDEEDILTRREMVRQLISINNRDSIPYLLDFLNDTDATIRLDALIALGDLDARDVIPKLSKLLEDKDLWVRAKAVSIAGKFCGESMLQQFIELMKTDKDSRVREQLCHVLGKIGTKEAIDALKEALHDENTCVRDAAVTVLHSLKRDEDSTAGLLADLKNGHQGAKCNAAKNLGMLKEKNAVPALIEALKDPDCYVREESVKALASIGDKSAIPALCDTLFDDSEMVRQAAVFGLERLVDKTDIPKLAEILDVDKNLKIKRGSSNSSFPQDVIDSQNAEMRGWVAFLLGEIGDKSAVPVLRKSIAEDKSHFVAYKAAEALVKLSDSSMVPALIDGLHRDDYQTRHIISEKLCQLADKTSIPLLENGVKDEDWRIRAHCIEILGKVGAISAIPPITKALNDDNERVRFCAITALERLQPRAKIPTLAGKVKDSDFQVRLSALRAMSPLRDEETKAALIGFLKDENSTIRCEAASVLGCFKDKGCISALKEVLNDKEPAVQCAAAEALMLIGDISILPVFIEKAKDRNCKYRYVAIEALGKMGDESILEILKNAAIDDDPQIRKAAVYGLARLGGKDTLPLLLDVMMKESDYFEIHNIKESLRLLVDKSSVSEIAKLLKSENRYIREAALDILEYIRGENAISEIIKLLRTDIDTDIRVHAAQILGNFEAKEDVISALMDGTGDVEGKVRGSCIMALGYSKSQTAIPKLVDIMKKGEFVDHITEALIMINDKNSIPKIKEILFDKSLPEDVRGQAASIIAHFGEKFTVVDIIGHIDPTKEKFSQTLDYALFTITCQSFKNKGMENLKPNWEKWWEENKDKSRVDWVLRVAKDKTSEKQDFAVAILAQMSDKRIGVHLAEILKETQNVSVQKYCIAGLGNMGDKKFVPLICQYVDVKDKEIAGEALLSLGKIGDEKAFSEIKRKFRQGDPEMRFMAAYVLASYGNKDIIPLFIQAMSDKEFGEFYYRLLTLLTDQNFKKDISQWMEWWQKNEKAFDLKDKQKRLRNYTPLAGQDLFLR